MHTNKFFILLAILSISNVAIAQYDFQRTYGFSSINEGKSVKNGVDGGFVISGTTSFNNTDIYILKINDNGTLNWQNTLGGSGVDHANCMTISYDSCYILAGYSNSFNGSSDYDIYVTKVDRNGQLVWQKTFGGPDWDFAKGIIQTQDSGFVIVGNTYNGSSGTSDGIFLKIDFWGNLVFQKIFNTAGDDYLNGVSILADGSHIATGIMKVGHGGSNDIIIEKIDFNGDSVFVKQYGSDYDEDSYAIYSRNGKSLIVGSNKDISGFNNLAFQINDNGDSLSTILLSHTMDEITTSLDTIGFNYLITGYTSSFGAGKKDLFISKVDSTGNDIFGKTFGGTEDEMGNSVSQTPDGGAISVGYSKTFKPGVQSVYIVKTDSNLVANTNVIIGLAEISNKLTAFSVFSDPITQLITLSCDPTYKNLDKLTVNIFDQNGKNATFKKYYSENKIQINLTNYSSGIYLINISDQEGLSFMLKILLF